VAGMMETSDEEDWAYDTLVAFGPNSGLIAVSGRSTCSTYRVWGVAGHQSGPSTEPVVFESG